MTMNPNQDTPKETSGKTEAGRRKKDSGVVLMDHEYDGIQEFDQRLPNWWLITLYGAIVFAVGYWFFYFQSNVGESDVEKLDRQLAIIQEKNLEATLAMLDNDNLWEMSEDPAMVAAGRETYTAVCVACHGAELEGGVGFNLADAEWVHPQDAVGVYKVIEEGVAGSGMAAWGGVLGPKRVAEVTAYVLSYHEPDAIP